MSSTGGEWSADAVRLCPLVGGRLQANSLVLGERDERYAVKHQRELALVFLV